MATRKYLTNDIDPQQDVEERELIIKISPREITGWEGTAAQLLGEGLIPKKFEWPTGRRARYWATDGFSYSIQRCRPDGIKGPMSVWTSGDWWILRRDLTADRGKGFAAANLYEARLAYERALWRQTPVARVQWSRYCMAREHEEFQIFLKRATGELGSARQSRSK